MLRRWQAQELYEGRPGVRFGLPLRLSRAKQWLIDTLWCRPRKRRLRWLSTREEPGRNPGKAPARMPWKSEPHGSIQRLTR
jgi:hypothetical protein